MPVLMPAWQELYPPSRLLNRCKEMNLCSLTSGYILSIVTVAPANSQPMITLGTTHRAASIQSASCVIKKKKDNVTFLTHSL